MRLYRNRFREKLEKKGYARSTIEGYTRSLEMYEQWVRKKYKGKKERETQMALSYLKHLQKRTSNIRTINRGIQPLRLYYRLFRKDNPFEYLYIDREVDTIKNDFFTKEELGEIYDSHKAITPSQIRTKVLLGLFLFQGVKSGEIRNIVMGDLDLGGYSILLKGDNRTNSRKIGLNIKQVILLNEYVQVHRRELLKTKVSDRFIVHGDGRSAIHNLLQTLATRLRKEVHGFERLSQLRGSVIHNWLLEHDLRKVQYLSGHRYISSTEKFMGVDLTELTENIERFHPFNQ